MESFSDCDIRSRFAPSPTGMLHIGGVRTAIFCYLFARHHRGKLLLRIEDTDAARSRPEYVKEILEGLTWLGLDWDEDIYYQSQYCGKHKENALKLVAEDKAYYCYCDHEMVEKRRKEAAGSEMAYKYDRHCLNLTSEDKDRFEKEGKSKALRFLVPDGETIIDDAVHGSVRINHKEIDDFVLLRSDGSPTYHLAVVSDDHEMKITHVIRGDDHLSNTPKQILLYKALGYPTPEFAHLPLIFGINRKKLSKRHGAVALSDYRKKGILRDVLFNYLALLGWVPDENREVFARDELIERFDLRTLSKNNAIFDQTKLEWLNGQYISQIPPDEILPFVERIFVEHGIINSEELPHHSEKLSRVFELLKSRVRVLPDFVTFGSYYFRDPSHFDEKTKAKYWTAAAMQNLGLLMKSIENLDILSEETAEECLRSLADKIQIKAGALIHPVRLALTGFGVSPGIFEVMAELGKTTVQRRLRKAIEYYGKYEKTE